MFVQCPDCPVNYDDASEVPSTDRHNPKVHTHSHIAVKPVTEHVLRTQEARADRIARNRPMSEAEHAWAAGRMRGGLHDSSAARVSDVPLPQTD